MNLNELVMKRGRGRGNRNILTKIKNGQNELKESSANGLTKKHSTSASSEINWGKSHISITNSSISKKSTGSRRSKSEDLNSRIVVALTEGRGEARCEVGIAAISVSMPFLVLCQISDSQNYMNTLTKINIFNPNEILVPATFVEHFSGNRLIDKVKERFPNLKYIGVPRSTYNKINGFEMLNNLCIPSLNGILLVLQHRYYALAAASALVCYIQDHLFIYYAPGTIKVDYQESEGYAVIDVSTADHLELVSSTRPAQSNKYASLFGVLNHCQTKIGARMLRSIILRPPFKVEYIENRLRCVDELIQNPDILTSIQVLLSKMSNVDSLLSIGTMISNDPLKNSTSQLNYVLRLNYLLDLIIPLKENLEGFTQPFFIQITKTLANEGFSAIKNTLRETIQDDAQPARGNGAILQRCFVIKPGINGLLDLVRKTYTERLNDLKEYVKSLAEKYDLALTLGNNQTKGYHIVLSFNNAQRKNFKKSALPDEFIEVHSSTGCCTMKTPELVNLSTRLDDIMNDILKISNVMVHAIIVDIKKHVHLFYIICDEIAQLDVIQSLASTSLINNYARPEFSGFTEISSARHPLLDVLLSQSSLVPNDINCSDDFNVNIVTGPNGSGKSIFIRQVLLLQIIAQIGCYVPAQSATFKPMDRMFARIYLEDNMEFGASSFILEMKEMKYIMTSLTNSSLVIIDELGRSTALEEGAALAIAILEKLSNSSAYIYITTHFTLLTRLYDMYPFVKIWQLETIPKDKNTEKCQLDYKYNILPGITFVKHYGVTLVRDIWPNGILKYVDCLLDKISKQHDPNIMVMDEKSRLKYSVETLLRKLKHQNELTIFRINEILNQYQADLKQLGYNLDIHSLESHLQGNLPLVDNNSDIGGVVDPNPALDRFLNDSNSIYREQNDAYNNIEKNVNYVQDNIASQNFFESDVFKKPTQSKNSINSAHTQLSSIQDYSDCGESIAQSSQQIPSISLSNDMDDHKFISLINDQSKTSTPIHFFDNICHYSSSSSSRQEINTSQTDLYTENVSNNWHLGTDNPSDANKISMNNYIHRNQYEHYISPIVIVTEGSNNTSISWKDQSDDDSPNLDCIAENKINIISDIKILSGRNGKSIEFQNNRTELNDSNVENDHERFNDVKPEIMSAAPDIENVMNTQLIDREDSDMSLESGHVVQTANEDTGHNINIPNDKIFRMNDSVTSLSHYDRNCRGLGKEESISGEYDWVIHSNAHDTIQNDTNDTTMCYFAPDDKKDLSQKKETISRYDRNVDESSIFVDNFEEINQKDDKHRLQTHAFEKKKHLGISKSRTLTSSQNKENRLNSSVRSNIATSDEHVTYTNVFNDSMAMGAKNHSIENNECLQVSPGKAAGTTNISGTPKMRDINKNATNSDPSRDSQKNCSTKIEANGSGNDDKTTSISVASKIRRLDEDISYSSTSNDLQSGYELDKTISLGKSISLDKNNQIHRMNPHATSVSTPYSSASPGKSSSLDNENSQIFLASKDKISVSYASALRNLDNNTNVDQTSKHYSFSMTGISEASKNDEYLDDVSCQLNTKSSASMEQITASKDINESKSDCDQRGLAMTKKFKLNRKRKFIPPIKLSAKEIKKELEEQDRKILESSQNSLDMKKYWEHIVNRPTVQQIRNSTHLALVRKTNEGVQVFPTKHNMKKPRRKSPIKRQFSNERFDMSIFSDNNAKTFEEYLNSGERDYKIFKSSVNHCDGEKSSSDFNPFGCSFNLVRNNDDNFVVSGTVTPFYEKNSSQQASQTSSIRSTTAKICLEPNSEFNIDTFNATLQNNRVASFKTQSDFPSLTPNGYYKQNKDHINTIMHKYLQNESNSSLFENNHNSNIKERKNIFESTNVSIEDIFKTEF